MAIMNSSSEQQSDFLFGNCPQCKGMIRFPTTARPNSSVSCPHCDAAFPLSAGLDQQVPEVKFLDVAAEDLQFEAPAEKVGEIQIDTGDAEKVRDKFVVPPQLAAGIRKRRRRRSRSSSGGASSSSGGGSSSGGNGLTAGSEAEESQIQRRQERAERDRKEAQEKRALAAARQGSSRVKPAPKNPAVEYVKIAVGAFMAIPIAYLLLMWVFSRDPLSLAPTIHGVIPAAVPPVMRPDDSEETIAPADTGEEEVESERKGIPLPVPVLESDDEDL
jgi:hypothetical protein